MMWILIIGHAHFRFVYDKKENKNENKEIIQDDDYNKEIQYHQTGQKKRKKIYHHHVGSNTKINRYEMVFYQKNMCILII